MLTGSHHTAVATLSPFIFGFYRSRSSSYLNHLNVIDGLILDYMPNSCVNTHRTHLNKNNNIHTSTEWVNSLQIIAAAMNFNDEKTWKCESEISGDLINRWQSKYNNNNLNNLCVKTKAQKLWA